MTWTVGNLLARSAHGVGWPDPYLCGAVLLACVAWVSLLRLLGWLVLGPAALAFAATGVAFTVGWAVPPPWAMPAYVAAAFGLVGGILVMALDPGDVDPRVGRLAAHVVTRRLPPPKAPEPGNDRDKSPNP